MNSPEGTHSDRSQQHSSELAAQSSLDPSLSESSEAASQTDTRKEVTEIIEQTRQAALAATQYVRDKPLFAVGIAAAVGFIAGLLARRHH